MKIKFNWGTGIFIVIVLFVGFFIGFIIFSFSHEINLVSKDYFPEEIAYESTLQKIKNTNELQEKVSYTTSDNSIVLRFPEGFMSKDIKGSIHFFYITDYKHDRKFEINLDNKRKQYFDLNKLKKGRYTIKIDWMYQNIGYYQEIQTTL